MRFRSLKTKLYFIILLLVLQLLLVVTDLYLSNDNHRLQKQQGLFNKNVNLFLENLSLEKDIEILPNSKEYLLNRYQELIKASSLYSLGFNADLLHRRIELNKNLFSSWEKQRKLHARLNLILPSLSSSVAYIHSHHIAYMKNIIRRGSLKEPKESEVDFKRHDSIAASELDIIAEATKIQTAMIDLIEIFSRLQRGMSPKEIQGVFSLSMQNFYAATNTFENYSLDAQDGLLTEELLLNGHTFEDSFKNFLALEEVIISVESSLNLNRSEILSHIALLKKQNEVRYTDHLNRSNRIKTLSLILNIILVSFLLFTTHKVIKALVKMVDETQKIQNDTTYKIPIEKSDFSEFSFVHKTLNLMSTDIGQKLQELSTIQEQLEYQVNSRTEELYQANLKLKEEIEEKIKNEIQRRELEEKLKRAEKMEALGTLAGGVAHDLNNILSGIVSYPELLLLDLPPDSPLKEPITTIKSSGDKAAVIVQDLLTMARRGVAKNDPLDMNRLLGEFLHSPECELIIQQHPNVDLFHTFDADIAMILGSKVHLQKSLTNLLSNAAESITGEGSITVSTSNTYIDTVLKQYDEVREGEYLKITIQDTGIGISNHNLERIFEPFFTTKTMGRSGSGLGMAVVWGTVKDHGGYIDVTSEKMKGTTFDLYFPLLRSKYALEDNEEQLENIMAKGETILVIDDIQEQREIASFMLNRLGYSVETADSGETAIDYLKYNSADILLLDMIMQPGIDGLETYRQIIKTHPKQKALIVSGYSESNKVREAQALGTGQYIKKPYTLLEIAQAIRKELDK